MVINFVAPLEYSHRDNVYRLRCNGDERSGTTA